MSVAEARAAAVAVVTTHWACTEKPKIDSRDKADPLEVYAKVVESYADLLYTLMYYAFKK
jgi:aromatic ring-opening dioxygenase catalytic subunit (LigB family)